MVQEKFWCGGGLHTSSQAARIPSGTISLSVEIRNTEDDRMIGREVWVRLINSEVVPNSRGAPGSYMYPLTRTCTCGQGKE